MPPQRGVSMIHNALRIARFTKPGLRGCLLWTGNTDKRYGYGRLEQSGVATGAHILSYKTFVGAVPCGMLVLHKCGNPPCVEPSHLELGTQKKNMRDMWARGRGRHGRAHPNAVLTPNKVRSIRALRGRGELLTSLAARFKVSPTTISLIARGKRWGRTR